MLMLLFAAGCGTSAEDDIAISSPWVREPNPARNIGAAFMVIENSSSKPVALVGASTRVARVVELHEMKHEGGIMKMSPVERIEVPAKGKVELKPGGLHLMLIDVNTRLKPDDGVTMSLRFDDGKSRDVNAIVRSMMAQAE
jgi:periplasmic copper chaperone A